jgi:hypothetical protein
MIERIVIVVKRSKPRWGYGKFLVTSYDAVIAFDANEDIFEVLSPAWLPALPPDWTQHNAP